MHTFVAFDGTVFNYNSDFSEVRINIPDNPTDPDAARIHPGTYTAPASVQVNGEALLHFFADCYLRSQKIEHAENSTWHELLDEVVGKRRGRQ